MVVSAWAMEKPLSLLFDPFMSLVSSQFSPFLKQTYTIQVLYLSVQTMGFVVADGKSNWMEGVILICEFFPPEHRCSLLTILATAFYVIVAVSYWFYPGSTFASSLAVCHAN